MKIEDLDDFTRHYLIAALWSSNDDSDDQGDDSMGRNYGLEDIHPDTVKAAFDDCRSFQNHNADLLSFAYIKYVSSGQAHHPDAGSPEACAGHDFWLTRNRHGCGFWDRGFGTLGDHLTALANEYGSVDLYVGDDGKIHSQ